MLPANFSQQNGFLTLAPVKCGDNIKSNISKQITRIEFMSISCQIEIALKWLLFVIFPHIIICFMFTVNEYQYLLYTCSSTLGEHPKETRKWYHSAFFITLYNGPKMTAHRRCHLILKIFFRSVTINKSPMNLFNENLFQEQAKYIGTAPKGVASICPGFYHTFESRYNRI